MFQLLSYVNSLTRESMRISNGTQKPKENHEPCSVKGCPNYYDVNQKDSKGKCKPCRKN